MRKLICGLVFVMTIVAMGPVLAAQEPTPFLAVQSCEIKQGEFRQYQDASQAVGDYLAANPVDLPGTLYGVFQGALNNFRTITLRWGGENLAQWDEWNRLRFQARRDDPQRAEVFRERFSHLESCSWSFYRRP